MGVVVTPLGIGVMEVTAAMRDVLAERQRQTQEEGFDAEHDDGHTPGDIGLAGVAYAMTASLWLDLRHKHSETMTDEEAADAYSRVPVNHETWPWGVEWWKPKSPRRDLVRAAALILAEIERLDRASATEA
jgi:hypothetical protein